MNEKEKKPDRRVVKTKRAIRNALATLLTQKDYNDITIKDIADTADINRKTFYNYYRGVYQVVEEIENEIIRKMDEIIDEISYQNYIENPNEVLSKMNAIMNEDLEFYGHLFSIKDGSGLLQKVTDFFKEKTKETLLLQFPALDPSISDILLDYTITGILAVYHQWFNSDRSRSLDEVSMIAGDLAFHGFCFFVEK